jgi:hypothetical protein
VGGNQGSAAGEGWCPLTLFWIVLAVAGAWLAFAAYRALLRPPRILGLSEGHVLAVLLGGIVGGLLLIVVAGIGAVTQ